MSFAYFGLSSDKQFNDYISLNAEYVMIGSGWNILLTEKSANIYDEKILILGHVFAPRAPFSPSSLAPTSKCPAAG